MNTLERSWVVFVLEQKREKYNTDTNKKSQVNKNGKSHCFNFGQVWYTRKHWTRDYPLLTEKYWAQLTDLSNLNAEEEEEVVEGVN